ncbi:MAG: anaerobic ribonucleoside-triphosphate reductase activating protein [Coriobacteriia bacterium]|nr:anaerobic ribonucleoside-triphosphate reductase activating protein [Coriobacteriia bacterium]
MPPVSDVAWFSSIDWPGRLCATVFLQGCLWRCVYCHNPDLQPMHANKDESFSIARIFETLQQRVKLLDGVVLSGGEPLYHEGSIELARSIAAYGFDVGLHTGGSHPRRLREMLGDVDWVGFDFKAPFELYERITRIPESGEHAQESFNLLRESAVAFEVRTTVDARVLTLHDLETMETHLKTHGIDSWVLQTCNIPSGLGAIAPSPESLTLIHTYYELHEDTIARVR